MNYSPDAFRPASDANKYTRGKLTVVAGSARYPGAAVLAARASQRMGAGYTEVITAQEGVDIVRLASPSLVVRAFSDWNAKDLPISKEGKPCAVCVGPGFVNDAESAAMVLRVLKQAHCPVIVDGGGLAALGAAKAAGRLAKRAERGFATVITPHGGEAARLARPHGLSIDDSAQLAAGLSRALHAIVVLKGPDTYVADADRVEVMSEGTPALAKAGTGDVLAGMIGALLAQGVEPFDAALAGSLFHARAGKAAAERLTDIAVCAEDVIEAIPDVLR